MRKATRPTQLGVCTDNSGYPAFLEYGKLCPVVPDEEAAKHGYIRAIDESGEDCGYSAARFVLLEREALIKILRPQIRRPSGRHSRPLLHLGVSGY